MLGRASPRRILRGERYGSCAGESLRETGEHREVSVTEKDGAVDLAVVGIVRSAEGPR
jgi:hypothetical protein